MRSAALTQAFGMDHLKGSLYNFASVFQGFLQQHMPVELGSKNSSAQSLHSLELPNVWTQIPGMQPNKPMEILR